MRYCFWAAASLLALGPAWTRAAGQQCRLQVNAAAGGDSGDSSGGTGTGSGDHASASGTSTATSTGASSTPTLAVFDYSKNKVRGVNLGGWFVLEPWITPSLFEETENEEIVDEYTYGQLQNQDTALEKLTRHWETWYTEDDFAEMEAAGINHVRIPLGYWSVPLTSSDTQGYTHTDPYVPGAWPYLLKALNWAKTHNIHTIVDLHGAPGSQNGYDNSGQRTDNPQFAVTPTNVSRALDTMVFIAKEIGGLVDVLELLNEGAGFRGDDWAANIRQYFQDASDAVRDVAPTDMTIMIGDAFLGVQSWDGFLTDGPGDVIMDTHSYQLFSETELERSFDEHITVACSTIEATTAYAHDNLWTVVGEWSNAVTDCAIWLNGRGVGARWDATYITPTNYHGSCSNYTGSSDGFSDDYKTFLRRYWEVQTYVAEQVTGWIYWTWKAENADEWSYQKGLAGGWIPKDPTDRLYPNICG